MSTLPPLPRFLNCVAKLRHRQNSGTTDVGQRQRINWQDTGTVAFTVTDSSVNEEVIVSAAASGATPAGAAGGDLTGTYPNPTLGAGAFATPALTLGTANAAGSSSDAVRTDATILAFDATVPTSSAVGDAAAAGSATVAARRDHTHGRESFATPAIVLGTAAAAGSATTPIRSNSTIVAFDATVPTTSALGDAAATGSAAVAARRDHVHGRESSTVGGDLTGTLPNPTIAAGAVDGDELATAVTMVDGTSNLLTNNPGFETGDLTGWSTGTGTYAVNTTAKRSGTYGLQGTASAGGVLVFGTATGVGGTAVTGGIAYRAAGWMKGVAATGVVRLGLSFFDSGGTAINASAAVGGSQAVTTSFAQITVVGVAPSNAAYVRIQVTGSTLGAAAVVYFDDFTLVTAATLTTGALESGSSGGRVQIVSENIMLYPGDVLSDAAPGQIAIATSNPESATLSFSQVTIQPAYPGGAAQAAKIQIASGSDDGSTTAAKATIQADTIALNHSGPSASVVTVALEDGGNLSLGTGTGTQIGTGTTQKIGFYGTTPIVQVANTATARTALVNLGLLASGGTEAAGGDLAGTYPNPTLATNIKPFTVLASQVFA